LEGEYVKRRHPITQEYIELTKVYGKTVWDLYHPNGTGMSNMLPDEMVFNKKHKFHDYFLNEYGLVMGMSYKITDTGFYMIEEEPTKEIMDIVDEMDIPELLDKALIDKLLPLFFTPFPDITNHVMALDIEVDNDYKQAINPYEAKYPMSSVSLYSKSYQMVYVLSDEVRNKDYLYELPEDINITICNSETELIKNTLRDITDKRKEKAELTFNGDKFDMIYLMCRAHILNIHQFDRDIWGRWDHRRQTGIKGIKNKLYSEHSR